MPRSLATALLTTVVLLGSAPDGAPQDRRPSGSVIIEGASPGPGLGVTWGPGRLTHRGKEYGFSIAGLGVADGSAPRVQARGEVYGLGSIEDFPGTYAAAGPLGAPGLGGAAMMVNAAGVTIRLTGVGPGVRLVIGPDGVRVALNP